MKAVDLMGVIMVDHKPFTKKIIVKMKLDPLGYLPKEEALQAGQDLAVVEIIDVNLIVMNPVEIPTSYLKHIVIKSPVQIAPVVVKVEVRAATVGVSLPVQVAAAVARKIAELEVLMGMHHHLERCHRVQPEHHHFV